MEWNGMEWNGMESWNHGIMESWNGMESWNHGIKSVSSYTHARAILT